MPQKLTTEQFIVQAKDYCGLVAIVVVSRYTIESEGSKATFDEVNKKLKG